MGSLEAILLNSRISSQASRGERRKEAVKNGGGKILMLTVSLSGTQELFVLSPSPAVLVVSPRSPIVEVFRGKKKTSHQATYSS